MEVIKTFRILLADDDPDDRELFEEAFSGLNAEVTTVKNGSELLKLLAKIDELPDYIFIDLNMPERNGKDCLKEIRANARFNGTRIVIYSTSSHAKDVDDTFQLGADLYVKKPSSFTTLLNIAANILSICWDKKRPAERDSFEYKAS